MVRPGAPPTLLSYWRQPLPGFYQLPLGSSCPSLCGQSVTPPEQNAPMVCRSLVDAGHSRPLGLLTGLETSSRSSISEPALPPQLVFSLRATNESSSFSNHSSAFTLINETGLQQNTWQAHSTRFQSLHERPSLNSPRPLPRIHSHGFSPNTLPFGCWLLLSSPQAITLLSIPRNLGRRTLSRKQLLYLQRRCTPILVNLLPLGWTTCRAAIQTPPTPAPCLLLPSFSSPAPSPRRIHPPRPTDHYHPFTPHCHLQHSAAHQYRHLPPI